MLCVYTVSVNRLVGWTSRMDSVRLWLGGKCQDIIAHIAILWSAQITPLFHAEHPAKEQIFQRGRNMMVDTPRSDLNPEERDRIEQFEAAYNAIKAELARLLDRPDKTSLNELVAEFARVHRRWLGRDGADLLELAQLRNTLVHDRTQPYEYLALPTTLALTRINGILQRLVKPLRVAAVQPARHVTCVTPQDSIIQVLALVGKYDYSQFPVYEGAAYRGLLTTNGIARWLSDNFRETDTLSCVTDCLVADVLAREEPVVMAFISRERTVEEVIEQFSAQSELVCLLVTMTGNERGAPQQIITRHDVANLLARLVEDD